MRKNMLKVLIIVTLPLLILGAIVNAILRATWEVAEEIYQQALLIKRDK